MNWQTMIQSLGQTLSETDYLVLLRPDVFLAITGVYLAVVWKRGALQALFIVLLSTVAMVVTHTKMEAAAGSLFHSYYFIAFLCLGALLVLYVVYLYALKEQVD